MFLLEPVHFTDLPYRKEWNMCILWEIRVEHAVGLFTGNDIEKLSFCHAVDGKGLI